ncbi:formate/nitrite transporter family protein [Halomarina pelagica]|uniref:formate/nitrite transporter family protein n=1 Tax=Halomarina pelagica TaxID=2961599 RepID=UPI0020C54EE5|nr:formate/nitrite transporter family protein [Halomarina sp. BND7]
MVSASSESAADGRSSDRQKSQEDILSEQIREGLSELRRPTDGLFLSALSAGLDIGFGPLLMAIVLTLAGFSFSSELLKELLIANFYAVGFIFVVLGRSELFTEHTTLAVLPVLDRRASVGDLARLWGVVYAGNVVGAVAFSAIVVLVAPAIGVVESKAFVELGSSLVKHEWPVLLAGGILAGWLMGLLSWLVAAAQESIARVFFVWIIATAIALAHLPHSIAGTVEVLMAVFAGTKLTLLDYGYFLLLSTVGNAIGGTVFVALLKYGHVVRSGPQVETTAVDD